MDESFAPVTSSVGFIELPLEDACSGFVKWRRSLYPEVHVTRPADGFPEVLKRLEPLIAGARPRELLVSVGTNWTAYFDNLLHGTDAFSAICYLSRTLQCQGLAISVHPHTIGLPGVRRESSGQVQFELFGPLGTDILNSVRTVSATFDGGRWVFIAEGTQQVFEETEAYKARRVRDRFTSDMLERYCQALGIDVFNPDAYGPEAVFVESTVPMPPNYLSMTIAEYQEYTGIIPGAAAHLPG